MMKIDTIRQAFQSEAVYCRRTGSEFAANFIEHALHSIEAGGPVRTLVKAWKGSIRSDCLPLRLLAAVHRCVLSGEANELGGDFPSVGGQPAWPLTWKRIEAFLQDHLEEIGKHLTRQVQTNEVQRSAVLLLGFLTLAQRVHLPMRLLEIGASAGLNLFWDMYQYRFNEAHWGKKTSPLTLTCRSFGNIPLIPHSVDVVYRAGCDLSPLDVNNNDHLTTLKSFIWADQLDRFERLRDAVRIARRQQFRIEQSSATKWLEIELMKIPRDTLTVVFNSVMWPYLPAEEKETIPCTLETAVESLKRGCRLAWIQFEGVNGHAELSVRLWPSSNKEILAEAEYNAQWIRWL